MLLLLLLLLCTYVYLYIYRFQLKCVIFCIFQLYHGRHLYLLCFLSFSGHDTRDLFSTIRNKFQFQFLNKYSSNWMRAAKIKKKYISRWTFKFMLWNGNFKTFSVKSCHRVFIGLLGKNEGRWKTFFALSLLPWKKNLQKNGEKLWGIFPV